MDAQEIFDKVVAHLRQQGKPAMGIDGACFYRLEDRKCAVGCLIEDSEYHPKMEHLQFSELIQRADICPASLKERFATQIGLITALQRIHDLREVSKWEDEWKRLAFDFVLTYTAPTTA